MLCGLLPGGRHLDRAAQGDGAPRGPRRVARPPGHCGSSRATTRPAAASRSAAPTRRPPRSATPSPPRARSPASTGRSRSAAGATWTAASGRPRTSTSSATQPPDLVICLNPTSSLHPPRAWNPAHRVAHAFRRASGRVLGSEAKLLRARRRGGRARPADRRGPRRDGPEPDVDARSQPRDRARRSRPSARQLREPGVRELLRDLPAGRAAQDREARRPARELAPDGRTGVSSPAPGKTFHGRDGRAKHTEPEAERERHLAQRRRPARPRSNGGTSAVELGARVVQRDLRARAVADPEGRPRRARPRLHPRDAARALDARELLLPRRRARARPHPRRRARCCSSATTPAAT